jgi:hypothetical protein
MLPLVNNPSRRRARLAGLATGLATIVRVTAALNFLALLVALPKRLYRYMLLWGIPLLIGLGALQWILFGSPFRTGYDYWGVSSHFFSLSYIAGKSVIREGPWILPDRLNGGLLKWVCPCQVGGPQASLPNLTFYPLLLGGVFWVFAPPFVPLLGLLYAWQRRRDPVGRYSLVVVVVSLLLFLVYHYQGTRYMAAPATILLVLASVWIADLAGRLFRRTRSTDVHARGAPALDVAESRG